MAEGNSDENTKFSDVQIMAILRQAETGVSVP